MRPKVAGSWWFVLWCNHYRQDNGPRLNLLINLTCMSDCWIPLSHLLSCSFSQSNHPLIQYLLLFLSLSFSHFPFPFSLSPYFIPHNYFFLSPFLFFSFLLSTAPLPFCLSHRFLLSSSLHLHFSPFYFSLSYSLTPSGEGALLQMVKEGALPSFITVHASCAPQLSGSCRQTSCSY